ncbi:MAG: Asp-tRNA(Asn)/Glu-tRNA(Gln) amidotransferase subunit GatC [Candidatus Moranbacteria bacterium]|nr:Asp-tRNA(Asn)/Glu-tRNA(Gln) amidotransferase subunit GatC [Candidatus Moranbacteria bacterium]
MLTKEEVKNIALLARIGIKEDEVEKYQKDLSAVLDFFRELETVKTDGVEPIGHITGMVGVARTDQTEDFESVGKAEIIKNVPETKDGFVKVKSVF